MYIQPNTTIKFLQNIPFDGDYNDTVYFSPEDGVEGQYRYFDTFTKYTINENYYQRVNKGELKVQLPYSTGVQYESTAEKLYNCNYMMFRNTNFGNKWFYAFIDKVEWVNNETAKVEYTLDVMQTWYFDYDLEQCFVEREHSKTDYIGDNVVPESLDMGYEMVENGRDTFHISYIENPATEDDLKYGWTIFVFVSKFSVMSIVHDPYVLWAADYPNRHYGPIQCGAYCLRFNASMVSENSALRQSDYFYEGDIRDFYDFIGVYNDERYDDVVADDILVIYVCPTFIANNRNGLNSWITLNTHRPSTLAGYTPRNNKLYTYPFMQLVASDYHGNTQTYKYEYFVGHSLQHGIDFRITGVPVFSPTLTCTPMSYLPSMFPIGSPNTLEGIDYSISINDFSQCSWLNDNFKAWWAQNKNSATFATVSAVLSNAVGIFVGNQMYTGGSNLYQQSRGAEMNGQGWAGALSAIGSLMAKKADAQNMPVGVGGLTNNSALMEISGMEGFALISKCVPPKQAKIIDDYFTMFGYACHEVKTPNRAVRERWTYTKTVGCTIKARCPGDDQKQICSIYDKGIRFWRAGEIGKYYNDDGTPVSNLPNLT